VTHVTIVEVMRDGWGNDFATWSCTCGVWDDCDTTAEAERYARLHELLSR
jgi:hypothetical protein